MVVIAMAIATPLVYYFIRAWLENFAYHIEIGWGIFALAGTVAVLIALTTVTIQTLKAALANPVDSLRNE